MCPERDSKLGLSISHWLKYEATALTTRLPRPDTVKQNRSSSLVVITAEIFQPTSIEVIAENIFIEKFLV